MTVLPKGSSKNQAGQSPAKPTGSSAVPTPGVSIGTIVQYEDDGSVILGVVTGSRKDKFLILNQRGREIELGRGRMYSLPGREPNGATSTAAKVQFLTDLSAKIGVQVNEIDVAEIWTFVHEEPRVFTVRDLCEIYFGTDSVEKHAALRVALIQEKTHFKREKDAFEPRDPGVVQELKKADAVRHRKLALREEMLDFVQRRVADSSVSIAPELADSIRLLEEVAANVQHSDATRQKEGKDLVHLCGEKLGLPESVSLEKQAFDLLVRIGHFHQNSNLSFLRNEIPTEHGTEALKEAELLKAPESLADFPEIERSTRIDFTGVRSFTIDDITTKDMDDALSIEQTVDGYRLGIHITDVAWLIPFDSALDRAARRRATSIYCADRTVNMLPELLSEGQLSLRQGAVRACISCLVSLNHELAIVGTQVVPTFIRSSDRYSYDQIDHMLDNGDATVLLLHEIAAACEERRLRRGAVKVHKREVVPFADPQGTVTLQEIDEDSPARSMVAEMMVLANSITAQFASDNNIPVLFRGQERPEGISEEGSKDAPEGPAKDFGARTKLKKSTVGFVAQYHSGLGLDAYIQSTSPIRRYMDLCHQRQLMSFFRTGKPWLTREEFEPLAHEVEHHLGSATVASRETRRFWLYRFLEQRGRKKPIEATIVRLDGKTPLVELDEVYITVFARIPGSLKLGDRVTLRINSIDPHADYLRLEPALA